MSSYMTLELDHPFYKRISAFECEKDTLVVKRDFRMLVHTMGTTVKADVHITILKPEKYKGVWIFNGEMMHPETPYEDLGLIIRKKEGNEELQPVRYLPVTRILP
ncbi:MULTISPECIES: hypothetical protein [Klebsiella]|uniref:hypothetical protein n=1 Tax=Klebsiella TaxID=570 RepID=UPI001CCCBB50|nr:MULTISPECIES: hypothetical protein [Klebsiella]HEO9214587.1 hypothetical protein [Klebsiella quasipneumoniae subsp. similipneumoniae]MBK2734101.1 hypothetical protein [Klebsiella pneumoniae]MBZ7296965.1 hypothetical protein [Klebsiella variicola]MDP0838428.1 hypothetical protein [Klebsiella pneumoniae]MDP0866754.1 hypothetical protein [Klebsiella pneumoniae]